MSIGSVKRRGHSKKNINIVYVKLLNYLYINPGHVQVLHMVSTTASVHSKTRKLAPLTHWTQVDHFASLPCLATGWDGSRQEDVGLCVSTRYRHINRLSLQWHHKCAPSKQALVGFRAKHRVHCSVGVSEVKLIFRK